MNKFTFLVMILFGVLYTPSMLSQQRLQHNLTVQSPCSALGLPKAPIFLEIYSNPTYQFIEIVSSIYPATIQLVDIFGRTIFQQEINESKTFVQTNEFPKGVYLLILKNERHLKTVKLLLN